MRIFKDAYQLVSEIYREVFEMGHEVHTDTYQNKVIRDDPNFLTKEIINYSYCLETLNKENYLYLADDRMAEYVRAEITDRLSGPWNPGEAWELRKDIWEQFLNGEGKFDYTYSERMVNSYAEAIMELRKRPDSRQAIISIWDPNIDPKNLGGKKRVPCSLHYQLLIRDNRLHIIYTMRSCDVMTHFGVDVALAWLLMKKATEAIKNDHSNLREGYLFHNIASLHCYKKDWPKLKQCIDDIRISTQTAL